MVMPLLNILIIVTVISFVVSWYNNVFQSMEPFFSTLKFWVIFWVGLLIGKFLV